MTTRTTRTQSAPRCARWSQDTNLAQNILAHQTAVAQCSLLRITGKTSSSEAATGTVPAVPGPDPESRERAQSDQMRSMFSVFICTFEPSPGDRVAVLRVGEKKSASVRECVFCTRRAVTVPEHPRDLREASGGAVSGLQKARGHAWTERAPKSPGGVRG